MSKASDLLKKLERLGVGAGSDAPIIRVLATLSDAGGYERLDEGKWVPGRFERNIRIDQPTHLLGGDPHAHVYGREGNEIVVVNLDGTASHGTKGVLHYDDAEALRRRGFDIAANNLVEWWAVDATHLTALFG